MSQPDEPQTLTGASPRLRPGEQRLQAALQRRQRHPRQDDPTPYDDNWGWWIDKRLSRIESQMKWLVALAASALVAELLRILFANLHLPP